MSIYVYWQEKIFKIYVSRLQKSTLQNPVYVEWSYFS